MKNSVVWAALLFLSCACCHRGYWAVERIRANSTDFAFEKLRHRSSDPVNGIDVEFVKDAGQIVTHLVVHSQPIAALEGHPHQVRVLLRPKETKEPSSSLPCFALRLEGGQRFVLPADATQYLLSLLEAGQEVRISLKGYHTDLKPDHFSQKQEAFLHPSPFKNPLHFLL